jgi:hypothetical protein
MSRFSLLTPSAVAALRSGYSPGSLRDDLFGGVTAAVVALPLALALGVASGAGPMAGLYGAIATGFFASLFGGTPAQITGPTGPMQNRKADHLSTTEKLSKKAGPSLPATGRSSFGWHGRTRSSAAIAALRRPSCRNPGGRRILRN